MVSTQKKLDKNQLEMLLWVYNNLDMVLDEGMTMGEEIGSTLNRALFWVLKALKDYEKKVGEGESERIFIAYIDHFNKLVVLSSGGQVQISPEKDLIRILKGKGMIREDIAELEKVGDHQSDSMIIASLEVFNEFLGAVVLLGGGLGEFHERFVSLVAEKIDTDIFQYNRLTLERLKNQGTEQINSILDSSLPLQKKYQKVMRLLVESVGAYSGYLVIPREGRLSLSNHYIGTNEVSSLLENDVILLAKRTVERKESNRFIQIKDVPVSEGQILSILLKPNEAQVEGAIILHHPDFRKGHGEVANAYSNLIDSTLHVNQLYAGVFENFLTAFGVIIDTFDNYPSGHSQRRSHYALALGRAMGLSRLEMSRLQIASILFDLDKVGIDPRMIKKQGLKELGGGTDVSEKILDNLFPFDPKSPANRIDPMEELDEEPVQKSPIESSSKIPILPKIIQMADTFDNLTSDRPYKRGLDLDEAMETITRQCEETGFPANLVELFKSPSVWKGIRHVFQSFQVEQAMTWFEKNMLPDIVPITKELDEVKDSLNEIRNVRSQFERGKEINLGLLEDTLLSPSDKDLLIQREAQKNPAAYNELLREMENRYKEILNKLEVKRRMETRFREKFWDPDALGEIAHTIGELNERGSDFYARRKDINRLLPDEFASQPYNYIMEMVVGMFAVSLRQKGLNKNYAASLKALEKALGQILEDLQD
jgi:HD-GYP domain-containing protein (c-di-GMP phosphodiesterase class II)